MSSTLEPNIFRILFSQIGLHIESNTEGVLAILCFVVTMAWLFKRYWDRRLRNYGLPTPDDFSYRIFYGVGFYCLALVSIFFLLSTFYIPGQVNNNKMLRQVHHGDFVLVNRHHYQIRIPLLEIRYGRKSPARGELIVFQQDWSRDVSRIIGLPGDIVEIDIKKKRYVVNEKPQDFHFQTKGLNKKQQVKIKLIIPAKQYLIRSDLIDADNIHRTQYIKIEEIIGRIDYLLMDNKFNMQRSGKIPAFKTNENP